MKTIERLRELQAKEERAKNSSDWQKHLTAIGDTSSAAYEALPALLAVVEAAEKVSNSQMHGEDPYNKEVPEEIMDALDAALRALEGGE